AATEGRPCSLDDGPIRSCPERRRAPEANHAELREARPREHAARPSFVGASDRRTAQLGRAPRAPPLTSPLAHVRAHEWALSVEPAPRPQSGPADFTGFTPVEPSPQPSRAASRRVLPSRAPRHTVARTRSGATLPLPMTGEHTQHDKE